MFEIYDWVEYNGNPARVVNKNSESYSLVVLEDVNQLTQNVKRIKVSNPDLTALDVPQFQTGENAVYVGGNGSGIEHGSVITIVKHHQKQGDTRAIITPFEIQKINY